jgi:YihY family inner membrane protein
MSTATLVPETHERTGDAARIVLQHVGRPRLLSDAFMRLRASDGFSHARSMAFVTSLVIVQGLIALVGLATALGQGRISDAIVRAIEAAAPGPAGQTLTDAVTQAESAGVAHRYLALTVGLLGTLITATTAMGQLERGLNRLYGIEQDRPTVKKYAHAFRLAVSAGALGALAFALVAFGDEIDGSRGGDNTLNDIWRIVSWPLAVVAITVAVTLLFRACPRRQQPARSWLAFGAGVAVVLWFAVTFALGAFFRFSSSFGDTYGPLAGIVALQLWALLSAVVVLYGGAVAAQLEAVRAGHSIPQDPVKVAASEPVPVAVSAG